VGDRLLWIFVISTTLSYLLTGAAKARVRLGGWIILLCCQAFWITTALDSQQKWYVVLVVGYILIYSINIIRVMRQIKKEEKNEQNIQPR
jgi:hypothetical protein